MRVFLSCLAFCLSIIFLANTSGVRPVGSSVQPAEPVLCQQESNVPVKQKMASRPDVMAIATKAVARIESNVNPRARRFESHIFRRLTGRRVKTFDQARRINYRAALMSSSCGMFQIMGMNYKQAGFSSPQEMFRADSARQVKGFHRFIKKGKLDLLLKQGRYRSFAMRYNGPAYRKNRYHEKLAQLMKHEGA